MTKRLASNQIVANLKSRQQMETASIALIQDLTFGDLHVLKISVKVTKSFYLMEHAKHVQRTPDFHLLMLLCVNQHVCVNRGRF